MTNTAYPTLAAFVASLTDRLTAVDAFVVSNAESEAVRLLVTKGGIKIAVDVEVFLSPDGCGEYHLDPYLTMESLSSLMVQGVLLDDQFAAMEQGCQIASALAAAYSALIAETARKQFADHVM